MATFTPTTTPNPTPTITTTTTTAPNTITTPTITTTPTTTTAPTITSAPREDPPPLVHALLPDFLKSIKLKYVKLGYRYISPRALLVVVVLPFLIAADADRLWRLGLELPSAHFVAFVCFLVISATAYFVSRPRPVYLVDFACGRPDDHLRCSNSEFLRLSAETGAFDPRSLDFQRRICERSGLGDLAYLPPVVFAKPPNPCMAEARAEAESVMLGAVDRLFAKTGVKPKDVGVLVVNCSLFNPTPSLSSMVIRRYKMRGDVRCFNLSGMGCSAGVIAVDLAKHLLRAPQGTARGGTYALVVSSENITLNWYWGNDRSMLLSNCIFRMGAAAVLLSNRCEDKLNAKYELVHSVRTHKGADDTSYGCVFQRHDSEGQGIGVALSKELMAVAGQALKVNITTLGPLVLPLREQAHFFVSLLLKKVGLTAKKPYIPDFKKAFEHFCIHAGGRGVLDEIEKNLDLSPWHMEPSRMTLYRFGNTSSSSLWYELAYTEGKQRVKKGDRVWQIAFGSGFKCNSAVWRALRTIREDAEPPWQDCIGELPVAIPTSRNLGTL